MKQGTVNAYGGSNAAAIGGGYDSAGQNVGRGS